MAAKGRKSGGPGKLKTEQILIVGAALVIGYLVLRTGSKKASLKSSAPEAVAPDETPQVAIIKQPKAYDSNADKVDVARARARFAARNVLGLKSLELKEKDGLLEIPFVFTPRKVWCQGGDLDTMKYAATNVAANEILISLEPSDGGKGDFVRTSVADLYKGVEHTFQVKAGGSQSFGLYICSDSKNAKSCKNKAVKSHADISKEAANAKDSEKNDYVFFFQHVVFDKNSLEVYRANDISESFKKSVAEYLTTQKDIDPSEFEKAWKVSKVMRSASADVQEGRLQLSLPYNDPRCMNRDAK